MPAENWLLKLSTPATYELHIQGFLDERWSATLGGAAIRVQSSPERPPVTVVTGEFRDQAALAGALNLLFDLGLPLLSVQCLNSSPETAVDQVSKGGS